MPRSNNSPTCDWVADPEDKRALLGFFQSIQSRIGDGGSWDATCLQEAEAFMAARGPPAKGAPKTAASIRGIWTTMKKVHDALLQVIQKQYPGASGWTYDREHGFSVGDDNFEAWTAFIKSHSVFKPFANKGWDLFDMMHDILPTRAKGVNVHNPAYPPSSALSSALPAAGLSSLQSPLPFSQFNLQFHDDDEFPDSSQLLSLSQSQPLTDWSQSQSQPLTQWSQSIFGSQSPLGEFGNGEGLISGSQPVPPPPATSSSSSISSTPVPHRTVIPASRSAAAAASQGAVPATPSVGMKRSASDEFQTPWTSKRGKTSGPDAILSLGKSVDNIGNALRDCFMPKESSALSPTKQVSKARQIAEEDADACLIDDEQRAMLSLIFGSDPKSADAYIAERTAAGRQTLTKILISRF
ncbi:hypothetical protein B0H13DRAFT_2373477 [Mycena leptocephala]|nr:hypothetical protein B0H13DRAFT_2375406 [Mycena leptocephala]KAJ7824580.1 hypothetical protein B0H13DRAFT_2375416 [Mycena leptocephala]KAJ7827978.1 hypothetical protein B0H13DRAFT_2373477 [Mycena leptocephala]